MLHLKYKFLSIPDERWIFISVLLINIVLICLLRFMPSMDGPPHLYNSNILLNLIVNSKGSLNDFYSVNSLIIPNWLGHVLLAGFRIIIPAWIAERIPEGSIVLPVDMTGHWLETHFSNYLGIEKAMIILENYEAGTGWFPVTWNKEKMPNILLGFHTSVSGITWITNPESTVTRQVDFVFLYGNTSIINESKWNELRKILNQNYKLVYSTENEYVKLYQRHFSVL